MSEVSKVIGLTGPTGAGKSTAAEIFRRYGAEIIDCDRLAAFVLRLPECIESLQKEFGEDIAGEEGVDRRLLAARAFSCPENVQKLDRITHPLIIREINRRIEKYKEKGVSVIFVDGALLFESGIYRSFDASVAVMAEKELRIKRIMLRDSITREQAEKRISAQKSDAYYRSHADYILDGGERKALEEGANQIFRRILEA